MVGIVFRTFGLARRSPRLNVDHVFRHRCTPTDSREPSSGLNQADLHGHRLNGILWAGNASQALAAGFSATIPER
jgi:hypothetical protein